MRGTTKSPAFPTGRTCREDKRKDPSAVKVMPMVLAKAYPRPGKNFRYLLEIGRKIRVKARIYNHQVKTTCNNSINMLHLVHNDMYRFYINFDEK